LGESAHLNSGETLFGVLQLWGRNKNEKKPKEEREWGGASSEKAIAEEWVRHMSGKKRWGVDGRNISVGHKGRLMYRPPKGPQKVNKITTTFGGREVENPARQGEISKDQVQLQCHGG